MMVITLALAAIGVAVVAMVVRDILRNRRNHEMVILLDLNDFSNDEVASLVAAINDIFYASGGGELHITEVVEAVRGEHIIVVNCGECAAHVWSQFSKSLQQVMLEHHARTR